MALVFALGGVGMTQAAETPPQVVVCQGCHQGALGFEGTSLDEMTESIAQLAASGKPHPPLPVKADVEAEAEALARALLKAAGQGATEK
ncbi:MAG: hypothetical protein KJN60_08055 [Boseongicola sp.]|nr:hypothetical protein [Boseongicola sp.]